MLNLTAVRKISHQPWFLVSQAHSAIALPESKKVLLAQRLAILVNKIELSNAVDIQYVNKDEYLFIQHQNKMMLKRFIKHARAIASTCIYDKTKNLFQIAIIECKIQLFLFNLPHEETHSVLQLFYGTPKEKRLELLRNLKEYGLRHNYYHFRSACLNNFKKNIFDLISDLIGVKTGWTSSIKNIAVLIKDEPDDLRASLLIDLKRMVIKLEELNYFDESAKLIKNLPLVERKELISFFERHLPKPVSSALFQRILKQLVKISFFERALFFNHLLLFNPILSSSADNEISSLKKLNFQRRQELLEDLKPLIQFRLSHYYYLLEDLSLMERQRRLEIIENLLPFLKYSKEPFAVAQVIKYLNRFSVESFKQIEPFLHRVLATNCDEKKYPILNILENYNPELQICFLEFIYNYALYAQNDTQLIILVETALSNNPINRNDFFSAADKLTHKNENYIADLVDYIKFFQKQTALGTVYLYNECRVSLAPLQKFSSPNIRFFDVYTRLAQLDKASREIYLKIIYQVYRKLNEPFNLLLIVEALTKFSLSKLKVAEKTLTNFIHVVADVYPVVNYLNVLEESNEESWEVLIDCIMYQPRECHAVIFEILSKVKGEHHHYLFNIMRQNFVLFATPSDSLSDITKDKLKNILEALDHLKTISRQNAHATLIFSRLNDWAHHFSGHILLGELIYFFERFDEKDYDTLQNVKNIIQTASQFTGMCEVILCLNLKFPKFFNLNSKQLLVDEEGNTPLHVICKTKSILALRMTALIIELKENHKAINDYLKHTNLLEQTPLKLWLSYPVGAVTEYSFFVPDQKLFPLQLKIADRVMQSLFEQIAHRDQETLERGQSSEIRDFIYAVLSLQTDFTEILDFDYNMNKNLPLSAVFIQKLGALDLEDVKIRLLLQTIENVDDFFLIVSKRLWEKTFPAKNMFFSLDSSEQLDFLGLAVAFRDRNGLSIANHIIKLAVDDHVDENLLQLALKLYMVCETEGSSKTHPRLASLINHTQLSITTRALACKCFSILEQDFDSLESKIFLIDQLIHTRDLTFQRSLLDALKDYNFLNSEVNDELYLILKNYNISNREKIEILLDLLKDILFQDSTQDFELRRAVALFATTLPSEEALRLAYELVNYYPWNTKIEEEHASFDQLVPFGGFKLFTSKPPFLLNKNKMNLIIHFRLLDLYSLKIPIEQISQALIQKFGNKLNTLEDFTRHFPLPFLLPYYRTYFRGVKFENGRGQDPCLDFFLKGSGSCQLRNLKTYYENSFAKVNQIYMSRKLDYALNPNFYDQKGLVLAISPSRVKEEYLRGNVHHQIEIDLHAVIHRNIPHHFIRGIIISSLWKKQLKALYRSTDSKKLCTQDKIIARRLKAPGFFEKLIFIENVKNINYKEIRNAFNDKQIFESNFYEIAEEILIFEQLFAKLHASDFIQDPVLKRAFRPLQLSTKFSHPDYSGSYL